jgi:outer membrane lipoprotein-sorting protein
MKKNASIIGFICLLVLVVFVSGCTSNNTTSNQSSQDVIVQITSNSPWNGTLTYNGTEYNITGTKNKNYNLGPNPGHVAIYLKKNNDTGNLTVQLLQGTNVIQTQSISSRQEVVSISHNF